MFVFSQWPPDLTDQQKEQLTLTATTYALAHGLLYLPAPAPPPGSAPASAIHAPLSLIPAPFPRALFERVQRLQGIYNVLYSRIALNVEFLDAVMGDSSDKGVARVDEFTRELWTIWKTVREEDERDGRGKPLHLGIFRSDYLLHAPPGSTAPTSLKQVEFNTISSSFGALSDRVTGLHRHLLESTNFLDINAQFSRENFPNNGATVTIVNGIAAAREIYEITYNVTGTWVLFVVQANERNVFDQRWLEYGLLEKYGIRVIRQSLDELHASASLDPTTRALFISLPSSHRVEISTIYFRACYTPNDFQNRAHYETRALLERARAISCPSLALQLSGGKKIQQVLTEPSTVEKFLLGDHPDGIKFTQKDVDEIRETWMEMWGLDEPNGVHRALETYNSLVLKPQREGGGNNVYRDSIPIFIESLPDVERAAWVAMRLIEPPTGVGGYLVRAGAGGASASDAGGAHRADVVSELGLFGWSLFGGDTASVKQDSGGWLVRTKGRESDEGGVAVGFSVLDSVVLVD